MFARRMVATWLVLLVAGVTAAVIFSPKPPHPNVGVGLALAATPSPTPSPKATPKATPTAKPVSGTYSQGCHGWIVSSTDSPTNCVAGPCTMGSISTPELDFLDSVGVETFGPGTAVSVNASSVSVSDVETGTPAAAHDNEFINPFGIILTGTAAYGGPGGTAPPGTPAGCFDLALAGSVTIGPIEICIKSASDGCFSNSTKQFTSDTTLTAVAVVGAGTPCSTVPSSSFVVEPLILECVSGSQGTF